MTWTLLTILPCLNHQSRGLNYNSFTRTADAAANLGLIISAPKTEYMTINCYPQPPLQLYGNNNNINHVSDFRYLGSMMATSTSDLKGEKDWLGQLFGNYNACGDVLTSQYQPKKDFLTPPVLQFCSMAVSHGSSQNPWKTKAMLLELHAVESCLNIKTIDRIPNATIYNMTNAAPFY